jgi:methionine sulfoxide reductase heme-binding subunit
MFAASSLTNDDWYLMRASGIVAMLLLTSTFVLGIATFRRWRPGDMPRFVTTGLHRSISLLSVVFLAIHVITAVADPYSVLGLSAIFVPYLSAGHSAFWVAVGTVATDLLVALIVSSLLRGRIGAQIWRAIHWTAYACWPLAIAHSYGMGTDAFSTWLLGIGVVCVVAVLAAFTWRLTARRSKHLKPREVAL